MVVSSAEDNRLDLNPGMLEEAMNVYTKMEQAGWTKDPVVKTLLVRILIQKQEFEKAFQEAEAIKNIPIGKRQRGKLVLAWNAIIRGDVRFPSIEYSLPLFFFLHVMSL